MFTFSQLCRFASRFRDGSAVPCPLPRALHPGWYQEDAGLWRTPFGTHTPDSQMSDIAAPAPTKGCCSPFAGSPAPPRPRQWHLPGLTSFLPLPPFFPPTRLRLRSGARPPLPRLGADLWLPMVSSRPSLGPETPSPLGEEMRGQLGDSQLFCRRMGMPARQPGRLHCSFQRPSPVPYYTQLPTPPAPGLGCPSRRLLNPSPDLGVKPTHLPAPPPVRTASCPSFAWAGAPRSLLRLLLPAPAVGITPARLQPAVPRTASRGGLEARATLLPIPSAAAAGLGTFLPAWLLASCWRLGEVKGHWVSLPYAEGTLRPAILVCRFPNLATASSTPGSSAGS